MVSDHYSHSVPTIVRETTELNQYPRRKTRKLVFECVRVSLTLTLNRTYVFSSVVSSSIEGTES